MQWMQISTSDLTLLDLLENIEAGSEVPEGCDIAALVLAGLATSEGTQCSLTNAGRLRLKNLKSVHKDTQRLPW
jgi:hypothetical protein